MVETLEQENKKLKELLSQYEIIQLISNQRNFNEWVMIELLKLKEGVNQIIDALNEEEDSEESEPELPEGVKEEPVRKGRPPMKKEPLSSRFKRVAKGMKEDMDAIP